jgi:hypothetical protein
MKRYCDRYGLPYFDYAMIQAYDKQETFIERTGAKRLSRRDFRLLVRMLEAKMRSS